MALQFGKANCNPGRPVSMGLAGRSAGSGSGAEPSNEEGGQGKDVKETTRRNHGG